MKVTVLFNLPDEKLNPEEVESDEDTRKSAIEATETLKIINYESDVLGIGPQDLDKIKDIKADIVFNLIEWTGKREPDAVNAIKILEEMRIPFTGSSSWGFELSGNKSLMKKTMAENNILTPKWYEYTPDLKGILPEFTYPVIVKPALEHAAVGITQNSLARDEPELRQKLDQWWQKFTTPILAEEYIAGRELHVTILERYGAPWVLPPGEVVFIKKEGWWPILSYAAKWQEGTEEYKLSDMVLANLDDKLKRKVDEIGRRAYQSLGGRDYPRLDLRVRGDDIYVLEINNNPGIGFDIDSGIGISARAVGFDYPRLLKHIVDNAYQRFIKP